MDKSGIFVGITVGSVSVFIIFSALFIIPMGTDETTKQMQNQIKNLLTNNNFNFEIKIFFNNFEDILSKTNIALCRSGAGTINDLINYKIPAIILPLPSSKNNHQFENAKILSEIGCAILADKDLKELDKILLFIRNVIDDKSFNNSLLDKYSKIKRYNTNLLMWEHIHDDQ